jgi:epoxyqueuosine reductase QueG
MISPPSTSLEERIKAQAHGLGFDLAGIARLGPAETAQAFDEWIARGYAGDMESLCWVSRMAAWKARLSAASSRASSCSRQ